MIERLAGRLPYIRRVFLIMVPALVLVMSLQAAAFFSRYAPDVRQANTRLFDLMVERADRSRYRGIANQIEALRNSLPATHPAQQKLSGAWDAFSSHFTAAPGEAISNMRVDVVSLRPAFGQEVTRLDGLMEALDDLDSVYIDDWRPLARALTEPPLYLRPTAGIVLRLAGYREAVTLNRALYLAQIGDIGTARVMTAGLNASVDEPGLRAVTYYVLARLQFELFRTTLEAEYYRQSLQYLRQSLALDPGHELAMRLLDYLLSLSEAETVPQSAEGRPETPSEGEGAAVSAEKRIF